MVCMSFYPQYGEHQDFLWRLARSCSDMNELTDDLSEKKSYALDGELLVVFVFLFFLFHFINEII